MTDSHELGPAFDMDHNDLFETLFSTEQETDQPDLEKQLTPLLDPVSASLERALKAESFSDAQAWYALMRP